MKGILPVLVDHRSNKVSRLYIALEDRRQSALCEIFGERMARRGEKDTGQDDGQDLVQFI